jgi:hypothetical protein
MGMQKKMFALWSTFEPRDLEIITEFVSRSTELAVACCKEIREQGDASRSKGTASRSRALSAGSGKRAKGQ